ncbi:hypothetical protein KY363_02510 [Candidatus Woesearchaeota archaeon]|nr:hypothetical protein [Candidatus Woesearchaeota archaeon]
MKVAHNVKLSVFAYEHEDAEAVLQTLVSLCPFDLEQEKLEVNMSVATGFQEKKIRIYELFLKKERHTTKFLESLKQNLSAPQRELIARQAGSRLDNELNFFIRLDKPKLIEEKKYWLTDDGNCFHIRMSVAAYPANRDTALDVVNQWLS